MMPPVVEGEETMYPDHENGNRRSVVRDTVHRYKWYIGGAAVILAIVLGVSIGVTSNKSSGSPSLQSPGDSAQPGDPLSRKRADLLGRIKSSYSVLGLPESHSSTFDNPESPQARALNWVASSSKYDNFSDDQRLQRYSLAAFFYATYAVRNAYVTQQVPWTTAEQWLSEEHECEWEGITCSGDAVDISGKSSSSGNRFVTRIELEEHRISGEIPLDLVLLRESLKVLTLTNNLIFMEGDALDVFGYLENLEELLVADNYIVERNGLPQQLRDLTKLRKLIMSYNLLQGAINPNYFENLGQLSHLEVESNYLSGPLPESIYEQDQLVYLYLRRNAFKFDLHHAMVHANWPSMFSMWLDHNNITGTFPTQVGKLTDLASFSLTNTTVHGTIPTEIGLLTGLRRVWFYGNNLKGEIPAELGNLPILEVVELYGNELTGTVPQGACDAVDAATYEYKVISADCTEVQCDCCTQCY